jgi:L-ascorbate metabolism protein UlaG (beta-lactamase superfamily)
MSTIHEIVLPGEERADLTQGSLFFVGNATLIIRYAGFTILTDPNFLHQGDHVHLGYGLTSKRLTEPAIAFENLPPFDFVLLSHLHEDHFDRLVARKLDRGALIVTTQEAAKALKKKGFFRVESLNTWETLTLVKGGNQLRVTSMPGRHGPGFTAKLLPPVMGSMLAFQGVAGKTLFHLYISGDTIMHDKLAEIPQRYPDIDMGLFHLGGTNVLGLVVTMDAKQGVEAVKLINPHEAIPVHYNDYTVMKSPIEDFLELARKEGLGDRIHFMKHGDTYTFTANAVRQ